MDQCRIDMQQVTSAFCVFKSDCLARNSSPTAVANATPILQCISWKVTTKSSEAELCTVVSLQFAVEEIV